MISTATLTKLSKVVGPDRLKTDPVSLAAHSFDGYVAEGMPSAVVFPKTTAEVAHIMAIASDGKIPITARGSGTNLSGGAIPVQSGIVLCLTQMNQIIEISTADRYAIVQPGVVNADLQHALHPFNFFFPPDPSSYSVSTIGGNIAEDAGGPRCLKYGVTHDYILGLEVVLSSGKIVRLGSRNVKDVTGYRPAGLFCGSEGTLGIVTEATLKIVPMPKARRTAMICYADLDDTANTVVSVIGAGVIPAAMELMDNTVINLIEDATAVGLPRDVEGILLVDVDGSEGSVDCELAEIVAVAKANHATEIKVATTAAESDALWRGRRSVYGVLNRLSPATIVEDATVPVSKIPAMIRGCRAIALKHNITLSILGHAGDGNLHPCINTDSRNKSESHRVEAAIREIFQLAIELGGCLSGEHGIGLAKSRFLPMGMSADSIDLLSTIKRAIDPHNILNPGKFT
jgi:glycolate oxidase